MTNLSDESLSGENGLGQGAAVPAREGIGGGGMYYNILYHDNKYDIVDYMYIYIYIFIHTVYIPSII